MKQSMAWAIVNSANGCAKQEHPLNPHSRVKVRQDQQGKFTLKHYRGGKLNHTVTAKGDGALWSIVAVLEWLRYNPDDNWEPDQKKES